MECLEFRRQLGSDPRHENAAMTAHKRECAGCSEAQARSLGFEMQLRRAMNVPVPTGLADRILLAQTTLDRRDSGTQRRRWYTGVGIAAALLLALGAGSLWQAHNKVDFPALVADHIRDEPESFASNEPMPVPAVLQYFDARHVHLAAALPPGISYAAPCPMGPYKTVHMVMPEADGPVTVFYLAGDRMRDRGDFRQAQWVGRHVPMGEGTLVLVAQNGKMFDALEQSWRHSIEGDVNSAVGAP
jgi:hypothetical protein